ncbi:sulfatase-like hydrolase/transferase [Tissierella carlieri]|uniref:sulfatase-like hydrolase/transferase n=1 Tax=Tissierella carlieri TaxID=689904 RepID=UPI001C0F695F|nr:sulfatase-like hydrolase/transferase [Tissierella carlieri]MBU5310759.1 sulfatase-like hydrolase/transferase [Tissierella carlieri]
MNLNNISSIKDIFNNKIEKAQYLKKIIRNLVEKGDFVNAKAKIAEYKRLFPEDIEIISIETVMLMIKGEIDRAEQHVLDGLTEVPFNFDLNYNLGFICQAKGKYHEAANAFIIAKSVATTKEEETIIQDAINEIKKIDEKVDLSKINQSNYKLFPLKNNDDTWIGKPLFEDKNGEGYISLYYDEALESYPTQLWNFYKTETLRGKIYESGEFILGNLNKSVLPLATLDKNTSITIILDNKEYKFNDFVSNRFYYIPIRSEGKVRIKSNNKFIIGEPLDLNQYKKHNVKLILNLFIDGLSQKLIDKYSLEKLMPNTYNFFNRGTIFNNCYSNAEWTLASVPTIFTGKYQSNHKIFHPELLHTISDSCKSMGTYFKEDNYLTFQSCGNWRKTPSYGYVKGFDRMIYQSATIGSRAEEIIFSFLEQMRAFEERDHFIWLSFFELHNIDDSITSKVSNQIINSIDSRIIEKDEKKSVVKDYDERKIERYINELNRIDFYLKIVYDFIENKYTNDEILVSLFSDHGQSYIDEGDYILRDARTRVPFMIRGKDISSTISDELMENIDILPTILEKASIKFNSQELDGKIPKILGGKEEKEYVYSESIYPGKTYKAVIRDWEHTLIFKSENNVEQDGRFILGDFSIVLENNLTKEDETNKNTEKVTKYFDIIISHISALLKI